MGDFSKMKIHKSKADMRYRIVEKYRGSGSVYYVQYWIGFKWLGFWLTYRDCNGVARDSCSLQGAISDIEFLQKRHIDYKSRMTIIISPSLISLSNTQARLNINTRIQSNTIRGGFGIFAR
jgi:hypothetical protein